MVRRSQRLQHMPPECGDLGQARLDISYGIKSNVFVNGISKCEENVKVMDGVRTRSMRRADISEENRIIQKTNVTSNEIVKASEGDVGSPKKKSKTKLKSSRTSKMNKTEKSNQCIKGHNDTNDCKSCNGLLISPGLELNSIKNLKNNASNTPEVTDTEFSTISQLDSLLPPTAPDSQDNSPICGDDTCLYEKESCFTNVAELSSDNKLDTLLSGDKNTNTLTYQNLFKPENVSTLNRLRKVKLPEKYEYLIEIFQGLEIVLRLLERRQKPFFYPKFIREQVENITKKEFSLESLLKIAWVSPQLISLKWCKTNIAGVDGQSSPNSTLNEFSGQYQLEVILNNGVGNPINRLSHSNINERIDIFRLILVDFALVQQENYLMKIITKNMEITTNILEFKCWSSFFDIQSCVDIPTIKLPQKKQLDCDIQKGDTEFEKRINSLSLTPRTRSIYSLKLLSNLSNIDEQIEQNQSRRSVSADHAKKDSTKEEFTTPLRLTHTKYKVDEAKSVKENGKFFCEGSSSNIRVASTPIRSIRSSYLLSRSISPAISQNDNRIPLSNSKTPKTVTIRSKNKDLLTPSQRDLLESVKRREKIKEISTMINVRDDDFNIKLEQIKDDIWTIQQISFVFLRTKKLIPTTQLPLLAKRLTTYARNSPMIGKVQDSIIRLSKKWPENIKIGDSSVEKGVKLVKIDINDDNLSNIILELNKEKESIFIQREEFRLETISKYQ
ncbi:hypothetical protein OJ252_1971 [Cryptosporidium canis]|uniref:CDT1 Geminin-binding domain-containing protein n=1 Tax=Cryptosporidium canis TaxID=195482 RepID=A0ABQ8P6N0_9CRYT|nr:hypothetical protein OJ252_1971 [Cryptosporidium canis]